MDDRINRAVMRMAEMAEENLNCSQILLGLGLEEMGVKNDELMKAIGGLADGAGFLKGTCGALTGGSCLLALFHGRVQGATRTERLEMMQEDLGEWFTGHFGARHGGIRCADIAGDLIGTPEVKQICGVVVVETYVKVLELLAENAV